MKATVWRVVLLALVLFLGFSFLVYKLFMLLKDADAVDNELARRDDEEIEKTLEREEKEESSYGQPAPEQANGVANATQ